MERISPLKSELLNHYSTNWGSPVELQYNRNTKKTYLDEGFCVSVHKPTETRSSWVYASCGLADKAPDHRIEIFMYSSGPSEETIDILLAISDYHISGEYIGLDHTVNFGIPWAHQSKCNFGFLSSPYLEKEAFLRYKEVEFLWVIPITEKERKFKIEKGAEELERKFEKAQLDYLNPIRKSVV